MSVFPPRQPKVTMRFKPIFQALFFVAAYVALDWASFLHPLHGLNITPWNPSLALGLVFWFRFGRIVALPWFVAILISEALVRSLPASFPLTLALSCVLTAGYGGIAEALRRHAPGAVLEDRRRLLVWLFIVLAGTLLTSIAFVTLLLAANLIPAGDWSVAMVRFWIGDCVGIVVTMPFFWLLFDGNRRLRSLLRRWETAAYACLAAASLLLSFGLGGVGEFQYFYLLFLPLVWAAARQGVPGAAICAFALQAGIIVAVQWQNMLAVTVFELQLLGAVLAFVGLFIGAVVDEKERISQELQQSLRLAAAGEMAGALAHELNQPLTALSAYSAACEQLLDRGETGDRLRDTIRRVVSESQRAGEVVRRLRDFFRTGATDLERVRLHDLIHDVASQFSARALQQGITLGIDEPLPQRILLVDRLQLEVVLRNLIANAFDAVADLPPEKRQVRLRALAEGQRRVQILVEDEGPGPAQETARRLFEPFQSTKSSGLGLGLAISRAIVEAHGGYLAAEAGGCGVFRIVLPAEEEEANAG